MDLRTDELSAHLIKFPKSKKTKDEDDEEVNDQNDDENKSDELKSYDKKDKQEFDKNENTNEEDTQVDSEDEEGEEEDEDNTDPKILITTTDITISFKTYKLCRELSRILPNANYFYRKNVRMSKVIPEAIKRKYSAIVVINEDHKEPSKTF